ncbi:hypothetical protein V6N12_031041 [Hibiscus sabdariffa]|uniref:RNase H type-1 domain-containing protein n=1 Tax=Hibiscus sabdariffa TaxID=183260 RepID=A0ABR2E7R9_9ROSI
MDAISVLQNKLHNNNPTSLISYVRDLCQQEWCVSFAYIGRRKNMVVGRLAKLASDSTLDIILYDVPPTVVLLLLHSVDVD